MRRAAQIGARPFPGRTPMTRARELAPWIAPILAVVGLLALAHFEAAGTASSRSFAAEDGSTAACPSPAPWDSGSPLYPQICGLPAFQTLLERWGVSNFTWGMTSTPTWDVV
jgi:hypothetical protein